MEQSRKIFLGCGVLHGRVNESLGEVRFVREGKIRWLAFLPGGTYGIWGKEVCL